MMFVYNAFNIFVFHLEKTSKLGMFYTNYNWMFCKIKSVNRQFSYVPDQAKTI